MFEQIIEIINDIDTQIFLFFNGLRHESLDIGVKLFSSKFVWVPMYASILYILLRTFSWKKVALYMLCIVLAITLSDQTCATLIRPLVERMRPSNLANPLSEFVHIVNNYRGGRYGFPSCHAANSFALAVFLSCMMGNRPFSIFIFVWAFLNSYSRIYLGVHYPGDLLIGGIIGSFFGWLCYRAARLLDNTDREQLSSSFATPISTPIIERLPLYHVMTLIFACTLVYIVIYSLVV